MKKNCANTQKCSRIFVNICCRPPHGGRGLKSLMILLLVAGIVSAPTRGPWIEIAFFQALTQVFPCRPPHGGRGLKYKHCCIFGYAHSRPPHGGRGLKFKLKLISSQLSSRPPHGGRGLKYFFKQIQYNTLVSAPTRGPWIEISCSVG